MEELELFFTFFVQEIEEDTKDECFIDICQDYLNQRNIPFEITNDGFIINGNLYTSFYGYLVLNDPTFNTGRALFDRFFSAYLRERGLDENDDVVINNRDVFWGIFCQYYIF